MPSQSQGSARVPHGSADHPSNPLGPGCWLPCMVFFGLSQQCYRALKREVAVNCTIGELIEQYAPDFTEIRGIGPSRSGELARVLRAGRYEQGEKQGMTEVVALCDVLADIRSELEENGRIGQAVSKGLDMDADLARVQCLRKIQDALQPVADQVASDREE